MTTTTKKNVTIKLPRESRVLLLEDSELRIAWFVERFPNIIVTNTVVEAIAKLADGPFDFMFLDHDLGLLDYAGIETETSGLQFCKHIAANGFVASTIFIHSWNTTGAKAMRNCLGACYAHVMPFGSFDIEVK